SVVRVNWGVAQRQLHSALTRAFEGSSPSSPAKVSSVLSAECRSGRGGGLQTRSYPVRVRIGAPCWSGVTAATLVLETSAFGRGSSNLSSSTNFQAQRVPANGRQAVSKAVGW